MVPNQLGHGGTIVPSNPEGQILVGTGGKCGLGDDDPVNADFQYRRGADFQRIFLAVHFVAVRSAD